MVRTIKKFPIGWYGDQGLGEKIIAMILSGRKTAATRPAYDPWDPETRVGDVLVITDKRGQRRGEIEITRIELRSWGQFDDILAGLHGMTLEEMRATLRFANAHDIRPDEDLRVVYFRLVSRA
jgi:uncharacterized protein YhfF